MVMDIKKDNYDSNTSLDIIGITGCKGFIGSNLCNYLSKQNINFTCFEGDLLNEDDINNYFTKYHINNIIHLAGTFNPPFSNLLEKNLRTTQLLLNIGSNYGLKKIIFSSTGAVYGNPLKEESYETDILKPNTLYGLVKQYVEECIQYYSNNNNLIYVILRFSNVYGEGNKKGVIYNFLNDIQTKKKITVAGDGKQRRDFLHVQDACVAIEKSLSYDKSDIFNISNTSGTSLLDLIKVLKMKYQFTVNHREMDNNLHDLILNTDKAKNKLGFQARLTSIQI
jgi:UDP-glucose 4-epimerase